MIAGFTKPKMRLTHHDTRRDAEAVRIEALADVLRLDGAGLPRSWMEARLRACDHLVVATNKQDDQPVGVLGFRQIHTGTETCLWIEFAHVLSGHDAGNTFRRLLAMAALRIAGLDTTPLVIATVLDSPALAQAFAKLTARMSGGTLYPQPDNAVTALATAGLARRIARKVAPSKEIHLGSGTFPGHWERPRLLIADMRAVDEARVIDRLRQAYKLR